MRIALTLFTIFVLAACRQKEEMPITLDGQAQGTTYHITYLAGAYSNYRESIDSIFKAIDASLSTYQPGSLISRINRNDSTAETDQHFGTVFRAAMAVSQKTGGLFDITVGPLINAYGFGPNKKRQIDPRLVDSLRLLVGFSKVELQAQKVIKADPKMQLDFNAIAQGYTVDVLAQFLEARGIGHYLIELGGELRAKGEKAKGQPWTVGIEVPEENPGSGQALQTTIALHNQSLATSGNYKKFYVENGKKFTHIIDPLTGLPARNSLLSATVVAADCMTADAYATAFMVMGVDRAKAFLAANPGLGLEVFFIYDDGGTNKIWQSAKFPASLLP